MSKKEIGLYIHIPFCKHKCDYCDFVSFANKEKEIKKYIEALTTEIQQRHLEQYKIKTVYIGGGTPSNIDPEFIGEILRHICKYFSVNAEEITIEESIIRDAHGNKLKDGDDVIVIKDLKVRGSSNPIKQGTKVRNISLVDNPSDGHDIDCRVDGFGAMKLKSEFVKKA